MTNVREPLLGFSLKFGPPNGLVAFYWLPFATSQEGEPTEHQRGIDNAECFSRSSSKEVRIRVPLFL